jgi:leader peptidase (prepilin peptidase)/N-methyltransferase
MFVNVIIFMIGLMLGSFLNVCIYRLPKGRSVISPRSACPGCGKAILWYDNIPVMSFIALGGKCRSCRAAISWRYPAVEILTALVILALFCAFGLTAKFFVYAVLSSLLIVATFVDFEIYEIPDEISLGGLAVGFLLALMFPVIFGECSRARALLGSLIGAAVGGGSIYLMGVFGEFVFKKEAMGGGDVKLMAMIGSMLGWKLIVVVFFIAPLFGSIVGLALKFKDGRDIIPYGPFLSLATIVSIFWGERILGLFTYRLY